jgi:Sulfatase-modifying factor enzyme 1
MRHVTAYLTVVALAGALPARTEDAPAKSLAITGVTVIDATGAPARPDMTVVVIGDRITAIGKPGEVGVPEGARVVDGKGKYLIPGLWDMHVHTASPSFLPLYLAPANVLERTGYRLPTEAEWEYACRAGALTARYYGASIDLLVAYAHYQAKSAGHGWPSADLLPSDLGLFDMLGNVYEWTQDAANQLPPTRHVTYYDKINIFTYIMEKHPRLLRGGAFSYHPGYVRSAGRNWNAPSLRGSQNGFRPARTWK